MADAGRIQFLLFPANTCMKTNWGLALSYKHVYVSRKWSYVLERCGGKHPVPSCVLVGVRGVLFSLFGFVSFFPK